jgi:ABC-type branched-subunit amino acid transport system substrate-binding protein
VRILTGRVAIVLATLVVLAGACSGSDDAGTPGSTPEQVGDDASGDGATDVTTGEAVAQSPELNDPVVPESAWAIDQALAADPNCGSPLVSESPLRVGYAGLNNESADKDIRLALAHFEGLINCSGGLNGQSVEITYADITGNAVDTRRALRSLVEDESRTPIVDVLLGPPEPDPGLRITVQTAGRFPVLFIGATEPGLADSGEFSYLVGFDDTASATAAAQFARDRGWSRAATFSVPGPYYGYTAQIVTQVFTASGGQVVGTGGHAFIPNESRDFSTQVAELSADPPDVIFSSMPASQAVQLKAQLAAAGLTTELLLSDSFEKTLGYTQQAAEIEGIYHVTHEFPGDDTRAAALYQSMSNAQTPASSFSLPALVGDAFAVLADSYQRADQSNPDITLAQSLGTVIASANGVVGITGVLSYDGDGAPTKPIYIHQVGAESRPVLAGTFGL